MTQSEWMKEGIDLKLLALLYRKKIWITLLGILVGAVFGGGLYFLVHVVYAPAREYEAVSKLYLTFAFDEEGDAYQYYNGYTWNDLMGTEPVLDVIMDELGEMDRGYVKSSVSADILSDIRLLTVTVRTNDSTDTDRIIRATEKSLIHFGEEMREFEKIEVIDHGTGKLVVVEDETVRAVLAGAAAGLLLTLLGLAFACAVDTSVYVPSDFEKRYGYPVLGVRFRGEAPKGAYFEKNEKELEENIALVKQDNPEGEIIEVPYGAGNGKLLERMIVRYTLEKKAILGAVITDADPVLYKWYFMTEKEKKERKK